MKSESRFSVESGDDRSRVGYVRKQLRVISNHQEWQEGREGERARENERERTQYSISKYKCGSKWLRLCEGHY